MGMCLEVMFIQTHRLFTLKAKNFALNFFLKFQYTHNTKIPKAFPESWYSYGKWRKSPAYIFLVDASFSTRAIAIRCSLVQNYWSLWNVVEKYFISANCCYIKRNKGMSWSTTSCFSRKKPCYSLHFCEVFILGFDEFFSIKKLLF